MITSVDGLFERFFMGRTPMITLKFEDRANIALKVEGNNQGGSIKDRAVWGMLKRAELMGLLKPGGLIVEPTSGNTGIALAMFGRAIGQKVVLTMPESMSLERRAVLAAYGAELVLTPAEEGMTGSIEKAGEIIDSEKNAIGLDQFSNPGNPWGHMVSTGPEILGDLRGQKIDAFVAGVGTGGTLTGIGRVLKSVYSDMSLVAMEPASSRAISERKGGPHGIQGIGAGFIPKNLDLSIVDRIITVDDDSAFRGTLELSRDWGLFCGISSGANFSAALELAKEIGPGGLVLTVLPDRGDKYISTGIFSQ